jgi:16S rRNA (guanine527-N7)-methyltransferase
MDKARIAELLIPFLGRGELQTPKTIDLTAVTQDLLLNISTYIDILLRWNSKINLTAIRGPEEIVTRHFGESLFAARHLFPLNQEDETASASLADLGSGAGFPGIPIKLWAPQLSVTLIESNHKKVAFLREVARALTLTDINIQNTRAETLPHGSFNMVTLRSVERFETILPTAAALVNATGHVALLIGKSQLEIAIQALPDFTFAKPIPIPSSDSRILAMAAKK